MELPALLPQELHAFSSLQSDDELFHAVISRPTASMTFFEAACYDGTWSESHPEFMTNMIGWLTKQSFYGKLAPEEIQQIAGILQRYFQRLEPYINKNIAIQLHDGVIKVNSLLLDNTSEWFKEALFRCRENREMAIELPQLTQSEFTPILQFICHGESPGAKMMGKEQLFSLIRHTASLGIHGLSAECESAFYKYLNSENVIEILSTAFQNGFFILEEAAIVFINNANWGFTLSTPSTQRLAVDFDNFSDRTLEFFNHIALLVTDLICKGMLVNEPAFGQILGQCKQLKYLNLHGTHDFTPYYTQIPRHLYGLDLSQCAWLSSATLKQLAATTPGIQELSLRSNPQLTFSAWGELLRFPQLRILDLSDCLQIKNDDLKIILMACKGLVTVNLSRCQKIEEAGFLELAKKLVQLNSLILAECHLTDAALAEMGARLTVLRALDLSGCTKITKKGIVSLVTQAKNLHHLNLSKIPFAPTLVHDLQQIRPALIVKT